MSSGIKYHDAGNIWQAELRRPFFRLSGSKPLEIWKNTHKHTSESSFDMHFELELGIVLSGRMTRFYQGYEINLEPGDIWMCGIWEPHGCKVSKAPCQVVVMAIWPELLANLRFTEAPGINWLAPFMIPPARRFKLCKKARKQILEFGRGLLSLSAQDDTAFKRINLRLALIEILMVLLKHIDSGYDFNPGDLPSSIYEKINDAIKFVLDHNYLITAETAAGKYSMDRSSFSKYFKAFTGVSFAQFGLRHRLSGSALELLNTDVPVKAIASKWGFTDTSHMHRLFLKFYGMTPAKYREGLRAVNL